MSTFAAGKHRSDQPLHWYNDRQRWHAVGFEIGLTAAVMIVYFLVRGLRPDVIEPSVSRALAIVHFEQSLGVFAEPTWQSAFLPHEHLMSLANLIYAWGHYPVLLAIAIWLVLKDPARFRFVRNVMIVSALIGIIAYWLLPTAPPRLLESYGYDYGFRDTVHGATSSVSYFQPGPFVNHYAAVPSFHFGWIALASAAIWVNTRSPWVRAGAVTMSVLMWWAVTVTGNHFFFDMVFGGVVVAISWLFVSWLSARPLRERLPAAVRVRP